MTKTPVQNRHGLNIMVRYTPSPEPNGGLVFLQHGYSGSMEQPHMIAFADVYLKNGYDVCILDATHSLNDADGELELNSAHSHYEDLCDCIAWASEQDWYREPFAICGHSLGGMSALWYAQENPDKISHLAPIATAISGPLLEEAFIKNRAEAYRQMKDDGYSVVEAFDGSGRTGKRPYSWLENMRDVDRLPYAGALTMPVLLIVGTEDEPTPPEHHTLLFDALPEPKTLHVLDGVTHNFEVGLDEVCERLDDWLKQQVLTKAA